MIERAKSERRRPGIVHGDERAAPVRNVGYGGNVLHLERQRSGRFGEDELGIRPELALDGCASERIVVADLDAEPCQMPAAEASRGSVDGIRDERVIARTQQGEEREGRRGKSGRHRERPMTALDLRHRILQVRDGRQAMQPV